MQKFYNIALSRMDNGTHYTFMQNTIERAKSDETVLTTAGTEIQALEEALANENVYLKIPQKSEQTAQINAARQVRTKMLRALKNALKGALLHPEKEKAEAAQKLWDQFNSYRINSKGRVDRVTGLVTNLVEDFTTSLQPLVELLSLTPYVESLSEANEVVRRQLMSREDRRGSYKRGGMLACRKATDEKYRLLMDKIEALVVIEGEAGYLAFITNMNEQIIRFKQDALDDKVSVKDSEESDSDGNTPDESTPEEPDDNPETDIPTEPEEDEPVVQ